MQEIESFTDARHEAYCTHCGTWMTAENATRDHVPTKTLLERPYPGNLPVVRVCSTCNQGFSNDEQYLVAFLSATISGSTDPHSQCSMSAQDILRYRKDLRSDIEKSKKEYTTLGGARRLLWYPDMERVRRVVLKNARGHALFELGEPMIGEPAEVIITPLSAMTASTRDEFETGEERGVWPEVGSRMMTRIISGQDLVGQWVSLQEGVYRYSVRSDGVTRVSTVMREYLATDVCW